MSKPFVAIYRNYLLPASETFVRSQAETLQHFSPCFVGLRSVQGLTLPATATFTLNKGGLLGKLREALPKIWEFDARFVHKIRCLSPRLIHAHFGPDGAIALPLARTLKIPLIVTFHGYDITISDEKAEQSLSQKAYIRRKQALQQEANQFIAVSEFIKRKLLDQGFPEEKIRVHYIGVDTEKFKPDSSKTREPFVVFVGRLVEKKGCEYLIQAMAHVQATMPQVELVVIGDGPLRTSLEQKAQMSLKRYRFLGSQSPDQIQSWMQKAQVFCVPSVTASTGDAEGFGIVFAEAQASGLPVVSFASGGIPEAVAHGETGFLAPERDAEGLASYILKLLKDQELWQRFSQSGQERVQKQFNLHQQTSILENIYADVVAGTHR